MPEQTKIKHFCFSNPKESNAYSQAYIAEPEKKFLEKFGRLSILINLNFKDKPNKQTLNWAKTWSQELIDLIKNDFYNPLRPVTDIEKDFEDSLQRINSWLQQEKSQHSEIFEESLSDFDVDIVLLKDNDIYFSQTGEINTYFLKDDQLIDLVEEKNKSRKFLNIISGKLENNSLLFFTTKNLFDYFSSGKVTQILDQTSTEKIEAEIKKGLSDKVNRVNLLGLIISNKDEFVPPIKKKTKPKAEKKEHLSKHEPQPEAGSRPPLTPARPASQREAGRSPKAMSGAAPRAKVEQEPVKEKSKPVRPITPQPKKERIPKKLRKIKPILPDVPIIKTSRLTYFRKSLIIILIILGLLFIQSIVILGRQQIKASQNRKYAQTIEELKRKQEELSAALIYQDPLKIKAISNDFNALLNQLFQKTEEQKQTFAFFKDNYTKQMNKFYHLIVLEKPEPLVDLMTIDKDIKAAGLTNIYNDFYIFDSSNNHIYLFNIETKEAEVVNQTSTNVGRLQKLIPLDNDSLIGFDQNQGIASFNTIDKKLAPLKLNRENLPQQIQDINIYGNRLYTLEPNTNQIYKQAKTLDGFGKEEAWIKDETNISDALSFTIDGSIYVMKKTAQIFKFHQGETAEFTLDEIQPVLSIKNPNILDPQGNIKIFTNDELKYLYLLDGPSKRLIILSKQGKLIKQFTSEEFSDLKDFIVSRKENKVWLLAGTKIFEIEI